MTVGSRDPTEFFYFVITIETPSYLYGFRISSAVAEGVYDD